MRFVSCLVMGFVLAKTYCDILSTAFLPPLQGERSNIAGIYIFEHRTFKDAQKAKPVQCRQRARL